MPDKKKSALYALPDLLFEVDETGRIFDYRSLQPELLAVPPEEFMGKRMDEVLPAEPSLVINMAIKEAIEKGHHFGGTYSLQMPNGLHWYEMSITIRDDSDPDNIRLIILARDITARKLSEEALVESEEKFRSLTEVTDAMIFIYRNQRIIYANPAATAITGYSREELLEISFMEFIHPDFHQIVRERIKSRMAGNSNLSKLELKIVNRGGEERWISYSADLIQYRGERAVLGTAFDITDHVRTEQALHKSERLARQQLEELETVYTNIPVGLCLLDREFRLVRINEQLARFNRRSMSEHIGLSVREVIPVLARKIEPILQGVLDTGEPVLGIEMSGGSPSNPNTIRNWVISYYPVKTSDGTVQGIGVVVTDITERKQTEELLRKMTEELKYEREELQRKNTALKEILFSLEQERQKFKTLICKDIKQAITPFLEKLRKSAGATSAEEIDQLGDDIRALLSENIDLFRERYSGLTSREIDICDMIKDGMSSKEISDKLDLSVLTIHKHREQIRKKLDIANRKVNLSTFLRLHV